MRSNKTNIFFKLKVYFIDQNTNIKTKKNVMFSIVWCFKLRLNDTFLFTSKKMETLILVISYYVQTEFIRNKVEK